MISLFLHPLNVFCQFWQSVISRTPLGWLQLKHDKVRLLVSIGGVLFADTLMFMQLGIMEGLYEANTMFHRTVNADIVLISPRAQQLINMSTFPRRRVLQSLDVEGVSQAQSCYLAFSGWRHPDTRERTNMLVVGISPDGNALNMPEIRCSGDTIKLPDRFMFDRGTRGNYRHTIAELTAGHCVSTEIDRHAVKLCGLFNLGASFATDGTLITGTDNFLRLFPRRTAGQVSVGLLRVKPGYEPTKVAMRLNEQLPDDVRALTREGFIGFERHYLDEASPISLVFGMGAAIGFVIGIVLVYQVLSTDVNDHMAEYATFKAMGFSDNYLYGVLLEQIAILSTVGFIPSVVVALGLYQILRTVGSLPIFMPIGRLVFIYLLTVAMCTASAFIASRKLRTASPAEIF